MMLFLFYVLWLMFSTLNKIKYPCWKDLHAASGWFSSDLLPVNLVDKCSCDIIHQQILLVHHQCQLSTANKNHWWDLFHISSISCRHQKRTIEEQHLLKRIDNPKMNILLLFTHILVISNLYDFVSSADY